MNTFAGELMGKDGLPLFPGSENSFLVKIELYPNEKGEEEKPFVIVEPDGSRRIWNGTGGDAERGNQHGQGSAAVNVRIKEDLARCSLSIRLRTRPRRNGSSHQTFCNFNVVGF
jgi:hypothetical protein